MKTIKNLLLSSLLACTLLSACKEKEEDPKPVPTYARGDRFVGSYRVTDDTGAVYTLTINKFIDGGSQYLRIDNLANMFGSINTRIDNEWVNPDSLLFNPNNWMPIPGSGPRKDTLNRTWNINFGYQRTGNGYRENYLYGNTIVLYFELSNLPYYGMDKVPYHRQFHTHIAVKQ